MSPRSCLFTLLAVVASTIGSQTTSQVGAPQHDQGTASAVAVIFSTEGRSASGVVRLAQTAGGLRVTGEITGLPPNSKHGFHIHEFGDMTVRDGTGMGGHYNPTAVEHGLPEQATRHVGDMGNVESDATGLAKVDKTFPRMMLGGRNSVMGRGIVVHEKADDGGQPTGNAGARIGYGVIGVAKSP